MTKRLTFHQRWVKALRSGEYRQATGVLRSEDNKYCCLGVACDLIDKSKWTKHAYETETTGSNAFVWGRKGSDSDYDNQGLPSRPARKAMELDDDAVSFLAELNDEGYSFTEIADAIEALDSGTSQDEIYGKLRNQREAEATA